VRLSSDVPALYTWLELPGARFSDSFFHLRPGMPKRITVQAATIDKLAVHSLTDTY
jgi:hypothetical protein